MYYPILRPQAQQQLKKIGRADIVIGLATYKNTASAIQVAQVALQGLQDHYPHLRTALVNADAGLKATTRRAVKSQAAGLDISSQVVAGRYQGPLGQGSATAALLDAALALDARAIIILDSHTVSITPAWVAGLAHLILTDKADLVLPRYQWSPLAPASSLSDLIVYPLFRALWGCGVRHPAAPDFALSPRLATAVLDEDIWETEAATAGFSPWLATYGVVNGWRVAQTALGEKTTTLPPTNGNGAAHLPPAFKNYFHDVVTVLLRQLHFYEEAWAEFDQTYALPTLTRFGTPSSRPHPAPIQDPVPLLDALALGWIEHRRLWQAILTEENLAQLEGLAALPPDRFHFPADFWARILYDFAVVFNKGDRDPYQIVHALFPIYQGRLAAFWQEIAGLSLVGCEGTVAAQALELEEMRAYLKIRWHTYEPRTS